MDKPTKYLRRSFYMTAALLVSMILFSPNLSAQEKATISGYLTSGSDGESLIGATVFIRELGAGTSSNEYGFYSLSVPVGKHILEYGYLGFEPVKQEIDLKSNLKLDIELFEESAVLEEIVVKSEAENKNVAELQMSVEKLDIQTIQKLPTLLGEVEIIRSLQLLPGVSTVGEGATGFNVRGGSIDQNLVLLDEAPVYNSSHLFGFFSVFNPDAVKDVKLYKGGIPSRYGGRLSSILDVRMKEGNSKQLAINGGIGTIFSRLAIEGPLAKDKASFIVAGRRSYIDILAQPFLRDGFEDSRLNFYDLTMKANADINKKNRIFLSGYLGRDNFGFGDAAGFSWGNGTGTLRWNHLFSDKLFSNFTVFYSDYDYQINFGNEAENSFDWSAQILNYSVKPEFAYYLQPSNVLRFGGQSTIYQFSPGDAIGVSSGEEADFGVPKKYAIESAVYLENELDIGPRIKTNYGLRLSHFNYTGKGFSYAFGDADPGERKPLTGIEEHDQWESIETYLALEPRASIKYQAGENSSVKASYNRTVQYLHLVSNTTAATPVDVWTPSTNNIKPQKADQVALGYFQNFKKNTYEFNVETYYKKMYNLLDYVDGADLLLNPFLEADLLQGDGRAYGLELQVKKAKGDISGWVSYTLGRTERLIEGINNDDWYPSRFDQTHNLTVAAFYQINKRWSTSGNFSLVTGTPATFPTSRYEQQGYVIPHNAYKTRNNVRIPTYHRLDLSLTLDPKENPDKRWKGQWVLSIYNLYARKNPFSIYFTQNDGRIPSGSNVQTYAEQLSVIGSFIPSISYNFKFK